MNDEVEPNDLDVDQDAKWRSREGLVARLAEVETKISDEKSASPVDEDKLVLLENARDAISKQLTEFDRDPDSIPVDKSLDVEAIMTRLESQCVDMDDWNMALMAESNNWNEAGMPNPANFSTGQQLQESAHLFALTQILVNAGICTKEEVGLLKAKEYMKALLTIRSQFQETVKKQKMRELLDLDSVEHKIMGPNGQPLS